MERLYLSYKARGSLHLTNEVNMRGGKPRSSNPTLVNHSEAVPKMVFFVSF